MAHALPSVEIGVYPTPFQPLDRLTREVGGARIWVKRDDMTGLAFGGSKSRALATLLGDAMAVGARTVVTCGPTTSNHVRLTAAAANRLGLRCVLVLCGRPQDAASCQGNMLLNHMLGAEIVFAPVDTLAELEEAMAAVTSRLAEAGARPYAIPGGGYSAIGALGYRGLVQELLGQAVAAGFGIDAVVFASGSGCIHSGLLAGTVLEQAPLPLIGLTINRGVDELRARVAHDTEAALALGGKAYQVRGDEVMVLDGYLGPGYARPSRDGLAAIALAARTEGLLLDPCYTGKAMAGVIDLARCRYRPGQNIVFIHTGGTPGIFYYAPALAMAA